MVAVGERLSSPLLCAQRDRRLNESPWCHLRTRLQWNTACLAVRFYRISYYKKMLTKHFIKFDEVLRNKITIITILKLLFTDDYYFFWKENNASREKLKSKYISSKIPRWNEIRWTRGALYFIAYSSSHFYTSLHFIPHTFRQVALRNFFSTALLGVGGIVYISTCSSSQIRI